MDRLSVLLMCALVLLGSGCGATVLQERGELQGTVYVLGSDPFSRLALALDERDYVVLECSPQLETYLRGHQGKRARVAYDGTRQVPEGRAVRVTVAELVEK